MALPGRLARIARLMINLALYPLAALAPRRRDRWAFGHAGELFAGNPKYLFLWLRLHRPDIAATWITGSERTLHMLRAQRLPVARRWSIAGMRAALGAGTFAFSHDVADVNLPLGAGARQLNLWHGVGLKALHAGARPATGARAWLRSFVYAPDDIVVSTSDMMQAHFAAQFGLPPERCPQLGYPRLDWAGDAALAALARDVDRRRGFVLDDGGHREIYLYVPTYRDTRRPFLEEALPDLDALSAVLAARGALLYVKPHPRTADALPAGHPAIRRWPDEIDFQTYLADFTVLVTDYSSVLYDYLAVRPVGAILYTFDYDAYVGADRALAHGFAENVAGLRVASFAALCAALRSGAALDPARMGDVGAIRARFWGGSPRPASAAIVDYVERGLAPPRPRRSAGR